ncbi:hypothetical protein [Prosthecomicrobium sp. N25]|uniref:hypothetical protein n=1 Tax=Prosthecomicrobium sp. N25 TaxID=3129254 RepID=UPI0030770F1E
MKCRFLIMIIAAGVALGGCERGLWGTFDIDSGTSARMDASQRLLLVTNRGGRSGGQRVVCAEPSPDSLTSVAASLAASAATASGQSTPVPNADNSGAIGVASSSRTAAAGLAATYAENAAFVGMRTQTIQLLRDGLYRACEAYMNGAIDETQYNLLLANMPRTMAALLAMDGLTQRPSAPPVIVNAPPIVAGVGTTTLTVPPAGTAPTAEAAGTATNNQAVIVNTPPAVAGVQKQDVQQITIQAPHVDPAAAQAVRDIALSVTENPTMYAVCVSSLTSDIDPRHDIRTYENGYPRSDPGYKVFLDMCRQLFKGLPGLYAEELKNKGIDARARLAQAQRTPAAPPRPEGK